MKEGLTAVLIGFAIFLTTSAWAMIMNKDLQNASTLPFEAVCLIKNPGQITNSDVNTIKQRFGDTNDWNDKDERYAFQINVFEYTDKWRLRCIIANLSNECGMRSVSYEKKTIDGKAALGNFIPLGDDYQAMSEDFCINAGLAYPGTGSTSDPWWKFWR